MELEHIKLKIKNEYVETTKLIKPEFIEIFFSHRGRFNIENIEILHKNKEIEKEEVKLYYAGSGVYVLTIPIKNKRNYSIYEETIGD